MPGAAYNGTIAQFADAYDSFVQMTGLLSDELRATSPEDARILTETNTAIANVYSKLEHVRGQAGQAIGLLTDYRPGDSALVGHVYALEGYAEVFLAELFCSGIPSTLDYHGEYTLQPGSTTEAVFTHAAALFDSALALAGDSAAFLHLARVGQARALLALGQYAASAAVVGAVPDAYTDTLSYTGHTEAMPSASNFADSTSLRSNVADLEGINGLDYRTSGDPRTSARWVSVGDLSSDSIWFPNKYASNGSSPLVLASGVEVRLIEAETALRAGEWGRWLGPSSTRAELPVPMLVVAVRPPRRAGSGGTMEGLPPLTDPGASDLEPARR